MTAMTQDQHDKVKRKALLAPDNARAAIASGLNPHSRPQFDNPTTNRQPVGSVDVGAVVGGMEANGVIFGSISSLRFLRDFDLGSTYAAD